MLHIGKTIYILKFPYFEHGRLIEIFNQVQIINSIPSNTINTRGDPKFFLGILYKLLHTLYITDVFEVFGERCLYIFILLDPDKASIIVLVKKLWIR